MVEQKKRRREGTDTDQEGVKALRLENEELRQEVERPREERARSREGNEGNEEMKLAKLEAGCKAPQEEEKEVKLPTEVWAIIAKKLNKNDVCSFALVSKQLREAQVLAGRKLVTMPVWYCDEEGVDVFTEDWCAYWSRKFNVHHTDRELIKRVLYAAARQGYLEVFEKYWSQGPQEKLSKLWDKRTCSSAAFGGHLEVMKWLRGQDPPCPWDMRVCFYAASEGHLEVLRWARSQGCPWDEEVPCAAAKNGHLEVLQWMRAQDPPCPWDSYVYYFAARNGHLEVLRWARSQGCPWDGRAPCGAASNGHLKVLNWLIEEGCPYDKSMCREAAANGGERARKVLEWLDE